MHPTTKQLPPIVSVAVLYNNIIHSMPKPNRHHNVVHAMNADREDRHKILHAIGVQGFLDADGQFLTREEAVIRAKQTGMITQPKYRQDKLYSEDLW
jgi:hypothetical protein